MVDDLSSRTQRDEAAVAGFVQTFGATLTAMGMQPLVARVIALMLADEDGRMTAAEIGSALQVSRAAVSGAMSFLREYRFVTTEREPGSRRDVYVLHSDAWHDTTLQKAVMLGYLTDQLDRGVQAVGGESTAAGRRLAYSREFYAWVAEELGQLIVRWQDHSERLRERFQV